MRLSIKKKYPPQQWHHDPNLKDKASGKTVYDRLKANNMNTDTWEVKQQKQQQDEDLL